MKMYVYTEKAEKRAEEIGVEPRRSGTVAMLGSEELESGMIAKAWERKGYVYCVEKEDK